MRKPASPEIAAFLAVGRFAVVGASQDRQKYGNKVLRCYQQHDLPVVGVNPKLQTVEGVACHARLGDVPAGALAVSVVAPPAAARAILADAQARGVRHVWFQPGAEDAAAIAEARAAGMVVIADGPCLLVQLGFHDD